MHSSRGFFVSGQQQQMGFPVLIPSFCSFGLVSFIIHSYQRYIKNNKKKQTENPFSQASGRPHPKVTRNKPDLQSVLTSGVDAFDEL
jgi:hypothetical protein